MDDYTRRRIADEQALQQGYQEQAEVERQRMLGATALDNFSGAQDHARNAQANDQYNQESQNREQGYWNNW